MWMEKKIERLDQIAFEDDQWETRIEREDTEKKRVTHRIKSRSSWKP
jgi:hypothetical protein